MKKSTTILLIIGILLLGVAAWAYSNWRAYAPEIYVQEKVDDNGVSTSTTSTTVNTATGTSTPGAPALTLAEVSLHKDATSCYSVISGKVYDLTVWINMHPGGKQAILSLCGTDGTERFTAQHHGAQKQMDILARFYIGKLTQ